ncbi:MAG: GNAT family N-acetyltransferase [Ignisphaera sp.]
MESSESGEDDSSSRCLDIIFRKAKHSEADDIFKIYNDSIEYLDKESKEWIESIIRKRSKRARIYVAIVDEKVVGFAIVYKKRNNAYIDALAVDIKYRGKGIGSCLLSYIEGVLSREGVEKIYLTVKNHNNKALGIYIKNGYKISNVIFILEARSSDIDVHTENLDKISIKMDSAKKISFPKVKLLDTALWSNFTWDVDEAIYRMSKEEAINIAVYNGKRVAGVAQITVEDNKITVERLAISYYKPSESLKILINAIKIHMDRNSEVSIIIPVDSTKSSLLKTLISIGFRIIDSEYVLHKYLSIEEHQASIPLTLQPQ